MSIMRCECDRYIDTDFDCEGVWEHNGTRFWCDECVQKSIDSGETAETDACMASFQKQSPEEYAEIIAGYHQ